MSNAGRDRGSFSWKDPRAFLGLILLLSFGAFVSYLSMRANAWEQYLSLYSGVAEVLTGTLGAVLGDAIAKGEWQSVLALVGGVLRGIEPVLRHHETIRTFRIVFKRCFGGRRRAPSLLPLWEKVAEPKRSAGEVG